MASVEKLMLAARETYTTKLLAGFKLLMDPRK
jgi:hypothetical protein